VRFSTKLLLGLVLVIAVATAVGVFGCGSAARLPVTAGVGPNPVLPEPDKSLIPLVHVVDAKGWPNGQAP
jgi:hypothetical protein